MHILRNALVGRGCLRLHYAQYIRYRKSGTSGGGGCQKVADFALHDLSMTIMVQSTFNFHVRRTNGSIGIIFLCYG